jgi:hypothetical protein
MAYSGELPPRAGRAAPTDRIAVGHPSQRQRLRLEGPNTPSAHLNIAR